MNLFKKYISYSLLAICALGFNRVSGMEEQTRSRLEFISAILGGDVDGVNKYLSNEKKQIFFDVAMFPGSTTMSLAMKQFDSYDKQLKSNPENKEIVRKHENRWAIVKLLMDAAKINSHTRVISNGGITGSTALDLAYDLGNLSLIKLFTNKS